MNEELELAACRSAPLSPERFNPGAVIPYGCKIEYVQNAMHEFNDFLGFINAQLHSRDLPRLESMLMPANFSSIVGEFMATTIAKYCPTLVKNQYHNGHPDLIPIDTFVNDSVQHSETGIEIKASRYLRGWQGHNPERIWLMVFIFHSNRPKDVDSSIAPTPFRFLKVVGGQLEHDDWVFSGRTASSRRTITASVKQSGYEKLSANWIYDAT